MKCSNCGGEWTPPKGYLSYHNTCPFCGKRIESKSPETFYDVFSIIIQNHGMDSLRDERIALGLFADYAPKLRREHSLLKQFYSCNGAVVLFQALNCSESERKSLEHNMITRMKENWIAEDAAILVCNSFLRAIGADPTVRPIAETSDYALNQHTADENLRITSADIREYYGKVIELISVMRQIYQKKLKLK